MPGVKDRDRWTSAGVTAGIDLFLALVEEDHCRELAHAAAGWLVVFVRRPGGQAQFSVQLAAQPARSRQIDQIQRWLPDHLGEDLSVDRLAERAGMSPRSFARAFRADTGTTPAAYVERLRIEAARRLLETSELTVAAVAAAVCFRRPETLHRAFTRQLSTTPDCYRQHFGTGAGTDGAGYSRLTSDIHQVHDADAAGAFGTGPTHQAIGTRPCRSPSASSLGSGPWTSSVRTRSSWRFPARTWCCARTARVGWTTRRASCASTSSTASTRCRLRTSCWCRAAPSAG